MWKISLALNNVIFAGFLVRIVFNNLMLLVYHVR